jgi:hypothetical protein
MATAETVGSASPQHYLWWFPGSPVKVHLALGVVQRLRNRLPVTGASNSEEGLLFGGTHDGASEILDFQPATAAGVADMVGGLAAERRRALVGYYRIEEGETFRLNAQDVALATECFAKPYNVFLIVHTNRFGPPTATFFFHDRDCRMADFAFLEFPFDPSLLAAEQSDRMQRSQQSIERPLAVLPPAPVAAAAGEVPHAKRRVLFKAAGWTVALALVFTLGTLFNNGALRERYSYIWRAISNPLSSPPAGNGSSSSAQSPSRPSMSLRAIRRGADLELTWNRDSPPIAAATSGTLSIQDGELTRLVSFDAAQLRDGSLLYFPRTDQIRMRLTVTTPTGAATESVMVILPGVGAPQTYPAPPQKDSSGGVATSPSPSLQAPRIKPSRTFTAPLLANRDSSPAASVLQEPPALHADSSAPAAVPNVVERLLSSPLPPPAVPSPQLPPPKVTTYEPPVAVVKIQPTFPPDLRNLIVKRIIVEVKVTIDKNGKVTKAEGIPQAGVNQYWLNSAVDAALAWKFKPARSNREPVWSEMILQFVYNR